MRRFVIRRLGLSVALLLVVPTVTFLLQAVTPGDVGQEVLGYNAAPSAVHALDHRLGLDQPIYTRYVDWLGSAVHGDLGHSYFTGQSVMSIITSRLPVTLSLIIPATLLALILGVGLGLLAARETRVASWFRPVLDVVAIGGMAIPGFWLAILLILLFSVTLNWLPAVGYVTLGTSVGGWAKSIVLPVVSLGFGLVTAIAKQTREQVIALQGEAFVRTLRSRGIPERTILIRHVLRAGSVPILTVVGLIFVGALTTSVFIENVFSLPGLGSALVSATTQHDLPVVMGVAMAFTVIVIVANLIIDVLYGVFDPRTRTAQ